MCSIYTQSTELIRLSETLCTIPPGDRSEIVWHCLGFVPAPELDEFETIGPIRAALATCWSKMPFCEIIGHDI